MDRKPLAPVGKPHTTPQFEEQSVMAARKRRLQMIPGNAPPTAPGEEPISHYQGADKDVVLGPVPMRLSDAARSKERTEDLE